MLLRIELENFFSIKEKISLDFRAGNANSSVARDLAYNVMDWKGQKVLKSIGLFGPNASGKSNIVKAINFCCRMIFESHNHNENTIFDFQPFKFDGWDKKPSRFLVNFVCEDIEYEYSFVLNSKQILEESLYYYPNNRRAKIFTRKGDEYSFSSGVIPRPNDVVINTSKKNLFVSRASSMNREIPQKIFRYFFETFLLGIVPLDDKNIKELFVQNKDLVLNALQVCDTDITDIEITTEKMPVPIQVHNDQMIELVFQERDVVRFRTYHKHSPVTGFSMETEESNGTRQLFVLLLRLLDVVKNRKSLMLDEFDRSLHTRLADFILDLIHASSRSQFLFTSHNTNLIDTKRLRKDQIVFVNKKDDGSTDVYSLYDFKDFRDTMDAEKGYLQGRFDAVPFVSSSVAGLKKLLEE